MEGGLTNQNYRLLLHENSYFLRMGSSSIALLGITIDREYASNVAASKLGIAPNVILYVPEKKIMITEFIPSAKKIDLNHSETVARLADRIKTLHSSKISFPTLFSPYDCIRDYYQKALDLGVVVPESVKENLLPWIESLEKWTENSFNVPCHLDLHSGNLIDDGKNLWLIDWEYAAMSDPYFDLATLAATENFSDLQMEELLSYYQENPTEREKQRLYLMRILADARWALWSYVQMKNSDVFFDYKKMGDDFLYSCLARLDTGKKEKSPAC